MTPEARNEILTAKAIASDWLSNYKPSANYSALALLDPMIVEYTSSVISNPTSHCWTEVLCVKRFIETLDAPGVELDTQAYTQMVKTHKAVKQDSEAGRRSFDPTPCQSFQYAALYALKRNGLRLTQKAVIFIPRKYAKTSQVGCIVLNELIHGPANGQIYFKANSEKQSKESFRIFSGLVNSLDPAGSVFKTLKTRVEYTPSYAHRTESFCQAVADNADTLDGLHASVVICDEESQADDTTTRDVLTTSMKGRANPLTIIITTASEKFNGPFYTELQAYKDLLLGRMDEPDPEHPVFLHLFEMDPDDDPFSPDTWRKVHPHMGITVHESDYTHDLADAKVSGGQGLVAFKTKLLNEYTTQTGSEWISARKIMDSTKSFTIDDLAATNLDFSISVDLSDTNDFTSITLLGWSPKTKKHYFYTQYFFPQGRMETHPNRQLYTRWANQGHLTLIPGDFINQEIIANRIIELADKLNPCEIAFDKFHAHETKAILSAYGYTDILKPVIQTNAGTTVLISYLEKTINLRQAVFPGNPIDAFCFSNVTLDIDSHDNRRMVKRGSNTGSTSKNKIDGAVTCMMACQMFFDGSLK